MPQWSISDDLKCCYGDNYIPQCFCESHDQQETPQRLSHDTCTESQRVPNDRNPTAEQGEPTISLIPVGDSSHSWRIRKEAPPNRLPKKTAKHPIDHGAKRISKRGSHHETQNLFRHQHDCPNKNRLRLCWDQRCCQYGRGK